MRTFCSWIYSYFDVKADMGPSFDFPVKYVPDMSWIMNLNIPMVPQFLLENWAISIYSSLFTAFAVTYTFIVFIAILMNLSKSIDTAVSNVITYVEKELNATDDLIWVVALVVFTYFLHFFGCFTFDNLSALNLFLPYLIVGLLILLTFIPTSLLINFGFFLVVSLRGASASLSVLYELTLDYINLVSYYLRLCVQLVRLVIITVTFYGYNHLIVTYSYIFHYSSAQEIITGSLPLTSMALRLVFEAGHVFVMFIAQLGAFCLMVFWLFQFLFTLFSGREMELSSRVLRDLV